MSKKKNHYINNSDLHIEMVKWKDECAAAGEKVPVSDYIGRSILEIATRLSHKPNFINYTYREEMIMDGVENCLQYMHNFDPNKSKNPFSYLTQIIYYAFLRRIDKEKKQTHIKNKMIESMGTAVLGVDGDGENIDSTYITTLQKMYPSGERKEKLKNKINKPKLKRGLENFYEDDEE